MNKRDYKNIWVYIENDGGKVAPVSLELLCEARKLCDVMDEKLYAVLLNKFDEEDMQKIRSCGIDGIITVLGTGYDFYNTDAYSNAFTVLSQKYNPSTIFVGGTINGRDFAPRFAVQLNTGCTSDAMEVQYDAETGDLEFIEPAVGGKIMAVITFPELRPQISTIRTGTFKFEPTGAKDEIEEIVEKIDFPVDKIRMRHLSFAEFDYDPDLEIADAEIIVGVGNGLKEEGDLQKYRELAKLLGGKLGCTRPLFDRDIIPYKLMIGQSGTIIKPKLYICFGVSGAVNHVAGITADTFVAVNTDPDAQIFNYCDYGIVGDMNEVCDLMISRLKEK